MLPVNVCAVHKPCKNGGTCVNTGYGGYNCKCPANYKGKNCDEGKWNWKLYIDKALGALHLDQRTLGLARNSSATINELDQI